MVDVRHPRATATRAATLLCTAALLTTAVACSDDEPSAADGGSSTTTSSTTSTTDPSSAGAQEMRTDEFVDVEPGAYFFDLDADESTPLVVTYEIAASGWQSWPGAVRFRDDGHTGVTITIVDNLVTDACEDPAPLDPPVGPTVDDLATALSELSPFELTEPPTDVTLLGYEGKYLKITVPDLRVTGSGDRAEYADCVDGNLQSWIDWSGEPFYGYNAEPGRYDEYWILDVDGTRVVISINSSPAMPEEDLDAARAIIDSIEFKA
jgi:hypothetical protein